MAIHNLPELHLLLGVGQRLHDVIVESMSEDEIQIHQDTLKRYNIKKSQYHGGRFEGNSMRLLLKHHGDLFLNKNCNAFIALRRFDSVGSSCFGISRCTPEFHERILEFEETYKMCGISCTTKVHIVSRHLVPFLLKYLPTDNGLAAVSELALESSHHHFNNVWRRYTFGEDTEGYGEGLFNAVCEFNFITLATDNAADVWKGLQDENKIECN
ncbi:hypothetical protein LOD99_5495 [Oopsacas minuta]|uniref:Uncharacterized protein n=1 Tax=Oopsacas minuta TaxID=111878 RepID=A0AAV7JRM4_9METZ|nr:hypothetical protein LOD99_5495 [Oopsacas minuta]